MNELDKNLNKYSFKRKKGIDDLLSEFAFHGASQGDETRTNNVEEYKNSGGWLICTFHNINPLDQLAINEEVKLRKEKNAFYIKSLKDSGEYGKEYDQTIYLVPNPIFDRPIQAKTTLESSRIIFLNDEEEPYDIVINKIIGLGDAGLPFNLTLDVRYKKKDNIVTIIEAIERECPYDNPSEKWYSRMKEIVEDYFYEQDKNIEVIYE